nr:MAG TPA: hypothetical protein [Caudoviricetes sp.]
MAAIQVRFTKQNPEGLAHTSHSRPQVRYRLFDASYKL